MYVCICMYVCMYMCVVCVCVICVGSKARGETFSVKSALITRAPSGANGIRFLLKTLRLNPSYNLLISHPPASPYKQASCVPPFVDLNVT